MLESAESEYKDLLQQYDALVTSVEVTSVEVTGAEVTSAGVTSVSSSIDDRMMSAENVHQLTDVLRDYQVCLPVPASLSPK